MSITSIIEPADDQIARNLSLPFAICSLMVRLIDKDPTNIHKALNVITALMIILAGYLAITPLTANEGLDLVNFSVNAGSLLFLGINLINLNTLSNFSVLAPNRLTPKFIGNLKIIWILIYVFFATPNTVAHIYMTCLSLRNDWMGVGLLAQVALGVDSSLQDGLAMVGVCLIGFHSIISAYTLSLVVNMALGKQDEVVKKPNGGYPNQKIPVTPIKMKAINAKVDSVAVAISIQTK